MRRFALGLSIIVYLFYAFILCKLVNLHSFVNQFISFITCSACYLLIYCLLIDYCLGFELLRFFFSVVHSLPEKVRRCPKKYWKLHFIIPTAPPAFLYVDDHFILRLDCSNSSHYIELIYTHLAEAIVIFDNQSFSTKFIYNFEVLDALSFHFSLSSLSS